MTTQGQAWYKPSPDVNAPAACDSCPISTVTGSRFAAGATRRARRTPTRATRVVPRRAATKSKTSPARELTVSSLTVRSCSATVRLAITPRYREGGGILALIGAEHATPPPARPRDVCVCLQSLCAPQELHNTSGGLACQPPVDELPYGVPKRGRQPDEGGLLGLPRPSCSDRGGAFRPRRRAPFIGSAQPPPPPPLSLPPYKYAGIKQRAVRSRRESETAVETG